MALRGLYSVDMGLSYTIDCGHAIVNDELSKLCVVVSVCIE